MLRDIINRNLVSCSLDTRVSEVASLMEKENVGSVLVLRDDRPLGIITDRDIVVRCISKEKEANSIAASEVMTESPVTVHEKEGMYDCIQKMRESHIRRVPVIDDDGKAVGILSFGDVIAILAKELADLAHASTLVTELDKQEKTAA